MANEVSFTGQSGTEWKYRVDLPLGSPGGFGGVYAAEASDGTPMAVKVIDKRRMSGLLDDRLLRREIDIGRRVHESGADMLLPVIDAADTGNALLLVMTRAGDSLSVAVPMSEADTMATMANIANGLQQLHSIGIIHRDLKPSNVLLHAGHWKLADFGIARDQEIGTQEPTFIGWGSLPYMAPELWQMKSPTIKSDLYAFGCLSFELLTGAPPYAGDQATLRVAHLTRPVPEIPANNVTLKNLIGRLLSKEPGDRPQDARAVLDRLSRASLSLSPLQAAIARELNSHYSEKSDAATQRAAAAAARKAREEARGQLFAQADADLNEVLRDALEELQAIEPTATLHEKRFSGHAKPTLFLATPDVNLWIQVWDNDADFLHPENRGYLIKDTTILLAGCVYIANRRHKLDEFKVANVAFERVHDRFLWRMYRFPGSPVRREMLDLSPLFGGLFGGPPARKPHLPTVHGLSEHEFLSPEGERVGGEREKKMDIVPFDAASVLELFREATEL